MRRTDSDSTQTLGNHSFSSPTSGGPSFAPPAFQLKASEGGLEELESDGAEGAGLLQALEAGNEKGGPIQRKAPVGPNGKVIQAMFTRPMSVAYDMHHDEYDNIFDDMSDFNYLWQNGRENWNTRGRVAEIVRKINDGSKTYDYAQLSNDTLTEAQDIVDLAASNDERMYVHNGNTIHTSTRAADVKKPHPTLVGGDPNVTCAGTLNIASAVDNGTTTYTVGVTNDSGHFRPGNVPDGTVDRIQALADNNPIANTEIDVENDER